MKSELVDRTVDNSCGTGESTAISTLLLLALPALLSLVLSFSFARSFIHFSNSQPREVRRSPPELRSFRESNSSVTGGEIDVGLTSILTGEEDYEDR